MEGVSVALQEGLGGEGQLAAGTQEDRSSAGGAAALCRHHRRQQDNSRLAAHSDSREGGAGAGEEGSEVTSGVQPHQPHLSPGGAEELQQLAAGPHQQLVPGADAAAAVEQDAASVLDGQQVHLSLVAGKVDVPAGEDCG